VSDIVIRIPRELLEQALRPAESVYYTPEDNPLGSKRAWYDACRRAQATGDFRVVRLGRRWLAWRDSFDAWLRARSEDTAQDSQIVDLFAGTGVKVARRR
jgi:hypothetical protein